MVLETRPLHADRSLVDVGDDLHGVRIAHRHDGDRDRFTRDLQGLHHRVGAALERDVGRREARHTHVHAHFALANDLGYDDPARRLDADPRGLRVAVIAHDISGGDAGIEHAQIGMHHRGDGLAGGQRGR